MAKLSCERDQEKINQGRRQPGIETADPGTHPLKGGGHNENEVADIIENALKLLTDVQDTGDVRIIQTALRELRYAFRLFEPYAGIHKVAIFGLRAHTTRPRRISAGRRFRQKNCQGRVHGHHRRRAGHHAGRGMKAPGRKKVLARTSACRGNRARTPSSPRIKSSSRSNIFLRASSSSSASRTRSRCFPAVSARSTKVTRPSRSCKPARPNSCRSCSWTNPAALIGKPGTSTSARNCCAIN